MFLLDNLLLAPGRAVLFLLEEVAKKAQEEFLDDDAVRQELQEIYAMLDAGRISEKEFEAREHRLVERLQQIAMAKLQEHAAGMLPPGMSGMAAAFEAPIADAPEPSSLVIDAEPVQPAPEPPPPMPPTAPMPPAAPPPEAARPPEPVPPAASAAAPALPMPQVIELATRGLSMLKLKVSTITSVMHDDGGWRVTAELVERRGVPDSSDLLGVYELRLDEAGNMLRYERTRMRRRGDLGR